MGSGYRVFASFFFTLVLILASLGLFHQAHQYTSTLVPHPERLSFLELACPLLSIFTYVSPIGSVIATVKNGDATHFPIQVILAQLAQNVAGAAYGILINNNPFLISSGVGLFFQIIWVTSWYSVIRHDSKCKAFRHTHTFLACLILTTFIVLSAYLLTLLGRDAVGSVSCALTLLLCISPLSTLGLVVRSMNSASIPLIMSIVMLITNVAWAIYGILLEDMYVFLPSLFGFIITVFQIIVSAWCNGFLFYDLTFLKWLYTGYEPVADQSGMVGVEIPEPFDNTEYRRNRF
jgi:solute carrier family 50 protein (sugar transporter)